MLARGGELGSSLGHWSGGSPWEARVMIGLPSTIVVPLVLFRGLIFGPFVGKEERHQDVALISPDRLLWLALFLKSSLIRVIFNGLSG